MSALPPKATLTDQNVIRRFVPLVEVSPALFDRFIGACQERYRRIKSERLRGLEVDDELEFIRKLDRQIAGLFALKDSIDVGCGASVELADIDTIGRQAPVHHKGAVRVDGWQAMLRRQRNDRTT